jgi:hypothetical protein
MVDLTAAAAAAARFVMTDFQIQLIDYDPFFLIFHSHSLLIFFYIFNLGFGISGSSFHLDRKFRHVGFYYYCNYN